MKANYRTLALGFVALALSLSLVPNSVAECGGTRLAKIRPSSWQFQPGQARLLQAAYVTVSDRRGDSNSIVGFWHVKFIAKGSPGLPDGTEIDAGYSQWHSDGTEIMNSGARPPLTGDFCLGVWKQMPDGKYRLNHFAASWDSTGTNLIGPAQVREEVTLSSDGNSFSGNFTIDQYDESGKNLGHVQGTITGTRIGVNTKESSIF
jgi:hypothetical protein